MSNPYFPADVSLRVDGELADAQALFPAAAQLLFKALRRQNISGMRDVRMFQPGRDGSLIWVSLSGGLKHVYVTPGKHGAPAPEEPEEEVEYPPPYFFPYAMYSGVVRPTDPETAPKVISEGDELVLDQFHPDVVTANSYSLDFAWQHPAKLAVNSSGAHATGDSQAWFPKPSNYSGAMKRVVQALYGIGWTENDTEGFISGELPVTDPDYAAFNQYGYTFLSTNGIHKADDGSIWIIEISKLNGVLAMQLPIFKGTDSAGFLGYLDSFGDSDTIGVVLEFGGLPTGEPIPTGGDLTDAIAAGKVLHLLPAADLLEFYRDEDFSVNKAGLWAGQGWAFNPSGTKADNLTFWYKNETAALSGANTAEPQNERFKLVQHWRVNISLNATPTDDFPYGTGTATVEKILDDTVVTNDTQPQDYSSPLVLVPWTAGTDLLLKYTFGGRRYINPISGDEEVELFDIFAPMWLFYDGETLEVVRNLPIGAGFYWEVNGFYGDSLQLGANVYTLETGSAGLVIPAGCREGYVLMRADMTANFAIVDDETRFNSTFPITMKGYFADVGLVEFSTMTELFSTAIESSLPDTFDFYTWASYWLNTGTSIFISGGSEFGLNPRCGASLNAGPGGGYVMTDGVLVTENGHGPYVGTGIAVTRPATTGMVQVDVEQYVIPIETSPAQTTFVGSP